MRLKKYRIAKTKTKKGGFDQTINGIIFILMFNIINYLISFIAKVVIGQLFGFGLFHRAYFYINEKNWFNYYTKRGVPTNNLTKRLVQNGGDLTYSLRISVYFEYLFCIWCKIALETIFTSLYNIIYYPIIILQYLVNYLIDVIYQLPFVYRKSVEIIKGLFDKILGKVKIPKEVEQSMQKEMEKEEIIKEGKINNKEEIKKLEKKFSNFSKETQDPDKVINLIDKQFFEATKDTIKELNELVAEENNDETNNSTNNATNYETNNSTNNTMKGGNNIPIINFKNTKIGFIYDTKNYYVDALKKITKGIFGVYLQKTKNATHDFLIDEIYKEIEEYKKKLFNIKFDIAKPDYIEKIRIQMEDYNKYNDLMHDKIIKKLHLSHQNILSEKDLAIS
jgi:antitoxin component HigA of HigAB toxin-antitoxin module